MSESGEGVSVRRTRQKAGTSAKGEAATPGGGPDPAGG